jgi:hypothetical protein
MTSAIWRPAAGWRIMRQQGSAPTAEVSYASHNLYFTNRHVLAATRTESLTQLRCTPLNFWEYKLSMTIPLFHLQRLHNFEMQIWSWLVTGSEYGWRSWHVSRQYPWIRLNTMSIATWKFSHDTRKIADTVYLKLEPSDKKCICYHLIDSYYFFVT